MKYERHFTEWWSRMKFCPVSDLKSPDQRKYLRSILDTRNSVLRQNLNNKESWISDGMFLGCVKMYRMIWFLGWFSDTWFSRMFLGYVIFSDGSQYSRKMPWKYFQILGFLGSGYPSNFSDMYMTLLSRMVHWSEKRDPNK